MATADERLREELAAATRPRRQARSDRGATRAQRVVDDEIGEGEIRKRGRPRDAGADEAILDASVELLAEQGFLALTIEAVAARAGVAKTTIYRRWPNKDDLLIDAVGCIKGPLIDPPGKSVRGDLLWMLTRMRDGWFKGRFGRLMARLAADGLERPDLYREGRARYVAPRHAVMQRIIQRGIDEGTIRADADLEWVIALLTSPVISAAFTHQEAPPNRQLEFIVDTVLKGVAP